MRKMEKTIIDLVGESCLANEKNDTKLVGNTCGLVVCVEKKILC